MNIRTSITAIGFLAFSGLAGAQGTSKEEWIKQEAEKEFKETTMQRLKALEDKSKDPKTGKEKDAWWDMIKFYGDFRVRHETIDTETTQVRHRSRIRVRLNMDAKVNDELDFGLRLATNEGGDPISTNQTLSTGFTKKPIWLDLAFIDWHPLAGTNLHVYAGKINQPFYQPGKSDLIWDNDITPEGAAVKYSTMMDSMELFATAAGYWINEKSTAQDDTAMFAAQLGLRTEIASDMKFTVGAGIFTVPDSKKELTFPGSAGTFGTTGSGNQTTGASPTLVYAKKFNEFQIFADLTTTLMGQSFTFYGDVVDNIGTSSDDMAWLAGFSMGKLKEVGDWAMSYNYRKLQRNSVIGAFTDSDSGGGGTNHKGSKITLETQLAKKTTGSFTYFRDQTGLASNANTDYHRMQFDLVFKF